MTRDEIVPSETAVLRVVSVTKRFGSKEAVHDLSFEVNPGEIVGLLGPNGAGKTTTMRMIMGIVPPSSGSISIDGIDVHRDPVPAKRKLFFVPDAPSPLSGMTGAEYIGFVAAAYRIPAPERWARLRPYIEGFALGEHLGRRVSEYSHGMKQKVVLAAAFMVSPRLLMLDEPMIGLDAHAAAFLKASLRTHAARGGSVLLSTHLMFLAEELCDRLVILSKGRKIAEGTLDSLRNQTGATRASLEKLFLEMTKHAAEV